MTTVTANKYFVNSPRPSLDSLRGKKILVTGAAGYIGGNLFRYLIESGLQVIPTVKDQNEAKLLSADGYNSKIFDLRNPSSWRSMLRDVDIVFHLAAMFQEYEAKPKEYQLVNCDAALKLAQEASRQGVSRFVHCSTVGVHGAVKEIPCTETTPFNPMDIYHKTKLSGELAVLEFAKTLPSDGMVVTVNRPAMVHGPGDMRMMYKLCKMIESGWFRMIGSGEVLVHLGFVEDQVDSFVLSATAPSENVHCESFNIASGKPCNLKKLVSLIGECLGVQVSKFQIPIWPIWLLSLGCEIACKPFRFRPPLFRRRIGFFMHNRAFELNKAQRLLGYESRWSLKEGVSETVNWFRSLK